VNFKHRQQRKPGSGGQMAAPDSPDTLPGAIRYFFTKPTTLGYAILAIIVWVLRIQIPSWDWIDSFILLGIICGWSFLEWHVHKNILHRRPDRFKSAYFAKWAGDHRGHHAEPWRFDLIFLESRILLAGPALLVVSCLLLPYQYALTFCGVLFYILVQYEWVHYIVHTRVKPKTRIGKAILMNHRLHHFRNEKYWYAFSVPLVDNVCGTSAEPGSVPVSSTTRTID